MWQLSKKKFAQPEIKFINRFQGWRNPTEILLPPCKRFGLQRTAWSQLDTAAGYSPPRATECTFAPSTGVYASPCGKFHPQFSGPGRYLMLESHEDISRMRNSKLTSWVTSSQVAQVKRRENIAQIEMKKKYANRAGTKSLSGWAKEKYSELDPKWILWAIIEPGSKSHQRNWRRQYTSQIQRK